MKKASGKSNISIVKDYLEGNRPFIQVGYTPDMIERKEGDVWKDANGNTWTYKNGQKKRISNISPIVGLNKQVCGCGLDIRWGTKQDRKFFNKTGRCFDCQIHFETELKRKGLYADYEQYKIFSNQKSYCLDMKAKLKETIDFLKNKDHVLKFMNEDGSSESWTDTQRDVLLESAEKDYKECLESLERIESQLERLSHVKEYAK